MSDGIPYADIIILALIAGFILLRLRSVLGDKVGNDQPSYFNKPAAAPEKQEPIIQLDEKSLKPKMREEPDMYLAGLNNNTLADSLLAIKTRDPLFSATRFLIGAKGAFEMVFDAFAKGDKATLKMLLSDALYQQFSAEITAREAQDSKTETTLISVQAKDITQASVNGAVAQIHVQFASEQVTVVRSGKGEIIGGDVSQVHHVEDQWVFERDVTSKNPNWKVIET